MRAVRARLVPPIPHGWCHAGCAELVRVGSETARVIRMLIVVVEVA